MADKLKRANSTGCDQPLALAPVTPRKNNGAHQDSVSEHGVPAAPRHVNKGCINEHGYAQHEAPSPREEGPEPYGLSHNAPQELYHRNRSMVARGAQPLGAPVPFSLAQRGVAQYSASPGEPSSEDDVFVNGTVSNSALVPSAAPFHPAQLGGQNGGNSSGELRRDSSDGDKANGVKTNGVNGTSSKVNGEVKHTSKPATPELPVIVSTPMPKGKGKQVVKNETHFLMVKNVSAVDLCQGHAFSALKQKPAFIHEVTKLGIFKLLPEGKDKHTVIIFSDTKSGASEIYHLLARAEFDVQYLTEKEFHDIVGEIPKPDQHEGRPRLFSAEVTVSITIGPKSRTTMDNDMDKAKSAVARYGRIIIFEIIESRGYVDNGTVIVKVELDSVGDAQDIILRTNTFKGPQPEVFGDVSIHAIGNGNEVTPPRSPDIHYSPTGRTGTRLGSKGTEITSVGYVMPEAAVAPTTPVRPGSGFRMVPSGGLYRHEQAAQIYAPYDPMGGMGALTANGSPHPAACRPQDVVDERIMNGTDIRTTLMIRNIPPEFTGQQLIDILVAVVPGEFDFSYNRIDFQKNQSVGYAFVNFTSTEALLRFVHRHRGHLLPHNIYRRHLRPCAVSYANTQGYECLVAKFRNSSILDEAKACRPHLFWTVESAPSEDMIGQERDWPAVDNQAKKERSSENAGIVGLYAKRSGGRGGPGVRRGFSQFDRGTMAQQNDEQQFAANYNYGSPMSSGMPFSPFTPYARNAGPVSQPRFNVPAFNGHLMAPPPMMAPLVGPGPVAPGSMLRSQTQGNLGYGNVGVMPAQIAPVHNPNDPFQTYGPVPGPHGAQPLLFPVKGNVPPYYTTLS